MASAVHQCLSWLSASSLTESKKARIELSFQMYKLSNGWLELLTWEPRAVQCLLPSPCAALPLDVLAASPRQTAQDCRWVENREGIWNFCASLHAYCPARHVLKSLWPKERGFQNISPAAQSHWFCWHPQESRHQRRDASGGQAAPAPGSPPQWCGTGRWMPVPLGLCSPAELPDLVPWLPSTRTLGIIKLVLPATLLC